MAIEAGKGLDPSLDDIVLVDRLPSDAWAEGIAVRPSGFVLATRVDGSELYSVDPTSETQDTGSKPIPPKVVHHFDEANCVLNICPLTGTSKEEYAVLVCRSEFATGTFEDATIWRLTFGSADATPSVAKVVELPHAGFCLGMTSVSDDTLVIADTSTPCALRVHLPSKKVSKLLDHPESMRAASPQEMFGVNRIRVAAGYLWYTNTSTGELWRAPIKYTDDNEDIKVVGPPQPVAGGLQHADGLVMARDGKAAYVASYVLGTVWKVDINLATGKGVPTPLLEDLVTPTAMDLVYKGPGAKPTLFVMCCGAVSQGMLNSDRGVGLSLANVDKSKLHIQVMITTEITVTYEPADAAE